MKHACTNDVATYIILFLCIFEFSIIKSKKKSNASEEHIMTQENVGTKHIG